MTFVLVELDSLKALEMVAVAGQGIKISGLDLCSYGQECGRVDDVENKND
jgi:hypothetical protein